MGRKKTVVQTYRIQSSEGKDRRSGERVMKAIPKSQSKHLGQREGIQTLGLYPVKRAERSEDGQLESEEDSGLGERQGYAQWKLVVEIADRSGGRRKVLWVEEIQRREEARSVWLLEDGKLKKRPSVEGEGIAQSP